jgi:hypothetical protein
VGQVPFIARSGRIMHNVCFTSLVSQHWTHTSTAQDNRKLEEQAMLKKTSTIARIALTLAAIYLRPVYAAPVRRI